MPDLVESARKYLGAPFRHQGRNHLGLDCGGLLVLAASDMGRVLDDIKGYARTPDGKTLVAVMERNLKRVNRQPLPNDIILFKLRKYPQHIAICTDVGIIHAHADNGKVVEHRIDEKWRSMIVGVFEL